MSEAIAVREAEAVAPLAPMLDPPEAVLAEAQRAAVALQKVLGLKVKKVVFNNEQYLEFEDWQTLGRFYAVTAGLEGELELVSIDGVRGFKATAVAWHHGRVISRASAYCLNDEDKWRSKTKYEWAYVRKSGGHSVADPGKDELVWETVEGGKKRPKKERIRTGDEPVPLFQLASMAQTRACAKALRNVLSWVAVLAGYRPTPAEELEGATETATNGRGAPGSPASSAPPPGGKCAECGGTDFGTATDGAAFCRGCGRAA